MTRQIYYMSQIVAIVVPVILGLIVRKKRQKVKKKYDRETWSKQKIEAFRKCSARLKVKELVDKHGQPNSVIQIKNKLRNLKDPYKQAKDNNKIGASLRYSPSI